MEKTTIGAAEITPVSLTDRASVIHISLPIVSGPVPWDEIENLEIDWGLLRPSIAPPDGKLAQDNQDAHPSIGLTVAVPTRSPVNWRISDVQWWRSPKNPINNEDLLRPGPVRLYRDVPIAAFVIRPDAGDEAVLRSLTLTIEHPATGPFRNILDQARRMRGAGAATTATRHIPAAILNRALCSDLLAGCRMALSSRPQQQKAPHPFSLSNNWLRCEVLETGVYAITGEQMRNWLIDVESIDPQTLRIFKGGGRAVQGNPEILEADQLDRVTLNEIAIDVIDDDGAWDSADEIRFYGFGGDAWLDRFDASAEALARYEHPFDAAGVYWLTWEIFGMASPHAGPPSRIQVAAAPPSGTTPTNSFTARLWEEQSRVEAKGEVQDNWFWLSNITGLGGEQAFTFTLPPDVIDGEEEFLADVRGVGVAGTPYTYPMSCDVWLNDDEAGRTNSTWIYGAMQDSLRIRVTGDSTALRGGQNTLHLRNNNDIWIDTIFTWIPEDSAWGWVEVEVPALKQALDSFAVAYRRSLNKGLDEQLEFSHWGSEVATPGESVDMHISLSDGQQDIQIWDVSEAAVPRQLAGQLESDLALGLTRQPTTNFHAIVFGPEDLMPVAAARIVAPRSLRDETESLDYVTVYHEDFISAALELTAFRNANLPGLPPGVSPRAGAFSVEEIYDNFSGGPKDLFAIRNFLHFVYELPPPVGYPPQWEGLRFVCFVGDATDDPRNRLHADPGIDLYDYVPTEVRTEFPINATGNYRDHPYTSDDGLVSFDASLPGHEIAPDLPDVACGRLTVTSAGEALTRVNRIVDFCREPDEGLWRNKVVFVADDFYQCDNSDTEAHTQQSEVLAAALPVALDMKKIYLFEYESSPGSCAKEEARFDLLRELNDGFTVFSFIGHGSSWNLSDEQVYMKDDSALLTNENRGGVFLAFSCAVGEYAKRTDQCLAEVFTNQDDGGGVAAICASGASWPGDNNRLSRDFFQNMYPDSVDVEATLGESLFLAKAGLVPGNEWSIENSHRYLLFGDPATTLPNPADGLAVGTACLDTLKGGTLQKMIVDLSSLEPNSWSNMTYDVMVQEAGRYRYVLPWLTVFLPGGTIFRGVGDVTGPELEIPLKAATQMNFGDRGRFRVIVSSPDGDHSVAKNIPVSRVASQNSDDTDGPVITATFANNNYRVKPGTPMEVAISDTSGINILGSNPANSILVEYDRSGFAANVSDNFIFDPGQFTSGHLSVPVSGDLDPGPHTVEFHASDGLGNAGSDTLSFLLVSEGVTAIDDITVFPNPTPGACRLLFELTDPMVIEWEIYTLAGKRLKAMREVFDEAGPKILHWDGRDADGDRPANGVYLYVLRGIAADIDGRQLIETGQIVIMK